MVDASDFPTKNKVFHTPRGRFISDEAIGKALMAHKGLQYLAAQSLGMHSVTLSSRISKSPYLQRIREEAHELRVDSAEQQLQRLIDEDANIAAIIFFLKTRGRHRGYSEHQEISTSQETMNNFRSLMNQITTMQGKTPAEALIKKDHEEALEDASNHSESQEVLELAHQDADSTHTSS